MVHVCTCNLGIAKMSLSPSASHKFLGNTCSWDNYFALASGRCYYYCEQLMSR